jgi:hypothetical protein
MPSSGGIHHCRIRDVLCRYNSRSWIRYPLALRVRRWVLASSSGIIPSWRYLVIDVRQFISRPGRPTVATISSFCLGSGVLGLVEAPGQAPSITAGSCLPGGVPGAETGVPSLGEVPGAIARVSSSSRMEGLKRSCANTPGGGDSRLDPSRARALAALLSHRRMWWNSKPSNFSSNLLTSCR